ncbi:MAG: glycosyltransferase family 4 protein [Erysipelotrichaceae bacterium]|nr:glycosyltransferase family 4 protein [Erysipelotrichaceae bacterium]
MLRLRAYFDPEQTAGTHLDHDLNEALAQNNITCISYTPIPTRGVSEEVYQEYLKRKNKVEQLYNGYIIVNRFRMFREKKNPIQRAFRYFLCSIREYQLGIRATNIDFVYSSSTPPTQGMLSALVAKKLSKKYGKKVPFLFNLQDIFPDSLVNTGMAKKGGIIWKIGRKIEDYTYDCADKIIVISEGFKQNIIAKGVQEDKIEVISNWVDLFSVRPIEKSQNELFDELGIDRTKFIVVYAGNLGESQGVDEIVDTAKHLSSFEDIQFVIFGGGVKFQEFAKRINDENISNIFITSLQPQNKVSEVYSMGDVALIICKPGTGNVGLPSKTWNIMACNTPIIASYDVESDLANVIKKAGAGYCVNPGCAKELADAIETAYKDWKHGNINQLDLRKFVLCTASKEICVQKYIKIFQNMQEN